MYLRHVAEPRLQIFLVGVAGANEGGRYLELPQVALGYALDRIGGGINVVASTSCFP